MVQFKLPDSCSNASLSPQRERISFQGLPKTPAPAPLTSVMSWESVLETDDEDDCYYSPPTSELSFHRRDITPTKKAESLLTLALKRQREIARTKEPQYTQQFVDEQVVDIQPSVHDYDNDDDDDHDHDDEVASTDGGAAFYAELLAQASLKPSVHEPLFLFRLATNLVAGIKRSINPITSCFGKMQQQPQQQQPLAGEPEPLLSGKQETITIPSTTTYVPAKPLGIIAGDAHHHHPFLRASDAISNEDHRLMKKQQDELPPHTAWVNEQCQIACAGPLGLPGENEGEMIAYLARDTDWVCCECSGVNSRWEFLCSHCGTHSKARCCQAVVDEIDGQLGFCIGA